MKTSTPSTVLIIDDHPLFRKGVSQLLALNDELHLIGEASSGEDGLEMAKGLEPDLILLDLNMKGMNGIETLRALREADLAARILILTVSDSAEDLVGAIRAGADGYLLKDMEPEELLERIVDAQKGRIVISESLNGLLAAVTTRQAKEMKEIWRKLVKAFHPDRCANDPDKRQAHEWLTAEINQARDRGDMERLREIAKEPSEYLLKHGMAPLSQDESTDVVRLRMLLDSLQQRILETLEPLNTLQASSGYELHHRTQQDSAFFEATVAAHTEALEAEIAHMEAEASQLGQEIEQLTGEAGPS